MNVLRWLLAGGVVLLAGCGVRSTTHANLQPPAKPVAAAPAFPPEHGDEDEPEEALEFARFQRSPDGQPIGPERVVAAVERARRMPLYSSRAGRLVPERAANKNGRAASIGTWTELGPGNYGGRTRALVIHPGNPSILWAGAVSGGIWKSIDGGATWTAMADLLPNIAISTIALDPKNPDILYAGTGEGFSNSDAVRGLGVYRSTDGGATWARLDSTANSSFYYVNKIVVSPNDSQRLYLAAGGGVYRSVDSGATWTRVLDRRSPNNGCQDLLIRTDQATDYLFAACGQFGDQGTLFRNVDASGGGKWEKVFTEANLARTSLALAPSNQSIIYALGSTYESGEKRYALQAVYRSTSNGDPDTWEARVRNTSDDRIGQTLLSNPVRFFAAECYGGKQSWRNQGWYDNVIAVDPVNPDVVWAGGIDLFRSDDGGATWGIASYWWASEGSIHLEHADNHAIVFHPGYDGDTNQTIFFGSDGGIYRTDNARAAVARGSNAACNTGNSKVTFKSLNNGYNVMQFYNGAVYPGGRAYFGGAQDNGTARGTDQGAYRWSTLLGGDGAWNAIDPNNTSVIYAENTSLTLVKSTDGGFNFSDAITGITEDAANFPFITQFTMDPNNSRNLWIGGKTLWRSGDGAASWTAASQALDAGTISATAVAPGNSDRVLFATSNGRVYRNDAATTADGSADWPFAQVRRTSSASTTAFISALAFDPTNQDIVYATMTTYKTSASDGHLYKSTDGGITWAVSDGSGDTALPDTPALSVVVSPDNPMNVYVGTDIGVFVSTDGGNSWAREDTGFASVRTDSLKIERSDRATVLYAFTHGRGAWRVTLSGDLSACTINVPEKFDVPAVGGSISFNVDTPDGCRWSALSSSSLVTVQAPGNGMGAGPVNLRIPVNTSYLAANYKVSIGDKTVLLAQAGASVAGNNDEPASATKITKLPYVAVEDTRPSTAAAATDPVHGCTGSADLKTVWFYYKADFTGTVVSTAEGTRYDNLRSWGPVLTAYPARTLTSELACDYKAAGIARIQFDVVEGSEYWIEVSAGERNSPGGYLTMTLDKLQ